MEGLFLLLLGVIAVRWYVLGRRLKRLLEQSQRNDRQIQELTSRVYALETGAPVRTMTTPPVEQVALSAEAQPAQDMERIPAGDASIPEPATLPRRRAFTGEEWEAVVGGNWLNKAGVLVLVIGIALFLGYSLTNLGAGGRVALGYMVSASMLALGVAMERRPRYVVFARGLIGGGWAALYFTTFALHALPAARVVESHLVGVLLLCCVAVGMVLHSLRYRSEVVTGLAFFIGFVTLVIAPAPGFSLPASVPLAAALLFLARRFAWTRMAAAGLVFTYSVYAIEAQTEWAMAGHPVLWLYWILFEGFDLLRITSDRGGGNIGRTLFPLNACGFLGTALLRARDIDYFLFAAAAAYAVTAIVRAKLRRRESAGGPDQGPFAIVPGTFEVAVTISAGVLAVAFLQRFTGWRANIALLMEAEFLVLSGVLLRERYLRTLGALIFAMPVLKLLMADVPQGGEFQTFGPAFYNWTPAAFIIMAAALVNRTLTRSGPAFTHTGVLLLALVLAAELPPAQIGLSWMIATIPMFAAAESTFVKELRYDAYVLGTCGTIFLWLTQLSRTYPWWPVAAGAALACAATIAASIYRSRSERERRLVVVCASGAAVLLSATFFWRVLDERAVAPVWAVICAGLVLAARRTNVPKLQWHAYVIAASIFFRAWAVNLEDANLRILSTAAVIAGLYGAQFLAPHKTYGRAAFSLLATLLTILLLISEVSGRLLTVAFGLEGVFLLSAGFAGRDRVLRLSGLVLFFVCVTKLFVYDLRELDTLNRIISFIVLGLLLLAASWIYTRFREQIKRYL
ncbi:MAG: DUF2339 domain-containing protein [Bryobacteraceae bacterium]|nr:DUF2339 domain-containing protein [Bryobacteraceae bacterium]